MRQACFVAQPRRGVPASLPDGSRVPGEVPADSPGYLVREDEVSEPEDAPVHLEVLTFAGI